MSKSERRLPKQERSRQRYNHILNTAALLFSEDGIDAVSTNHIAAKAEVSIGSVYQFFPNKEAIVEAIIERFIDDVNAVFPENLDAGLSREAITRQVLEEFLALEQQKQGFNEVMLNADNSMADRLHTCLVEGVSRVLRAYYPQADEEKMILCANVTVFITKGLMMVEGLPPDKLLDQMVLAVSSYQSRFFSNNS